MSDLEPDVTFVDGNGRLHPRGAGLACHLGVVTGLRTVGIGKTFLHVDGLTKRGVREARWRGCTCMKRRMRVDDRKILQQKTDILIANPYS